MNDNKEISDGELFADLQVTLTEILLIESFNDKTLADVRYKDRLEGNEMILSRIKRIILERFSDDDLIKFLDNGFPRQVNLGKILPS